MSEKAYVFFLRFQGSKGDPGMTGPTGAAGLPVSLVGSEVALHLPWSPTEALSKQNTQGLGQKIQGQATALSSVAVEAANSH